MCAMEGTRTLAPHKCNSVNRGEQEREANERQQYTCDPITQRDASVHNGKPAMDWRGPNMDCTMPIYSNEPVSHSALMSATGGKRTLSKLALHANRRCSASGLPRSKPSQKSAPTPNNHDSRRSCGSRPMRTSATPLTVRYSSSGNGDAGI